MDVVSERCCGLDSHKKSVVACLLTPKGKEVRTFGTMTADLQALADWLLQAKCPHGAMEATGVFWKPIYTLLEGRGMELLVVNAQHIRAVPGRKTDVRDAEWHPEGTRDLVRHGLLRGRMIPDRAQRELQELIRYRRSLIEERSREVNRIQKVLEGANIKLAGVATDIMGLSGRAILEAIVAGTTDPAGLAGLARGKRRAKRAEREQAVQGLIGPHQRMVLQTQLGHIDFLDEQSQQLDREIEERLRPFEEALARLDTIPGVGTRGAQEIVAAIGTDVSVPSQCPPTSDGAVAVLL